MKVSELCEKLKTGVAAGEGGLDREVGGCYIGDLLSLAMSKVGEGNVWITIQTNINIVAVSVLTEAACVILCDGQKPDAAATNKANLEDIPLLVSERSAYELACELSRLGI
jgi:predicted transcriptional regulator